MIGTVASISRLCNNCPGQAMGHILREASVTDGGITAEAQASASHRQRNLDPRASWQASDPGIPASRAGWLRRHWPPEGQIQLLTAALADLDAARPAWRQWRAENDLAVADHAEVRLLAAVAGRIREIEPDMPLDPRLEGMRRYIWAVNQVTLSATRPLLAAMNAAGLRLTLIKGAARLATDPGLAKERAVRDIDVLIHPEDWERAVGVALEAGWRPSRGGNDQLSQLTSHAVGLSSPKGRAGGEFDLHRFAIRQNQCRGQDLDLWERARRASFQGIDLLCPSPTDQAMIALSQAVLYNHRPHPAHWALDISAFLRTGEIDWSLFLQDVHLRRIELFVAAPLLLLRERLLCPVPDHVLTDLTRPIGKAYRVEFETRATSYKPATEESVAAFRIVASARAMRMARARPINEPGSISQASSTFRAWWLDRGDTLEIPVPPNMPPFARLRLEVSFQAWHAGRSSQLRIMAQDLVLALVPVAHTSRKVGGRVRYRTVLRFPACLIATRGVGAIQIATDRKLRVRDICVRFGPPSAESAFANFAAALKSRLGAWLSVRRPAARRASL